MKDKQTPAQIVIRIFGGQRPLSRELGIHASTISRWQSTGGRIPQKYWKSLMDLAQKQEKRLTVRDLAGID